MNTAIAFLVLITAALLNKSRGFALFSMNRITPTKGYNNNDVYPSSLSYAIPSYTNHSSSLECVDQWDKYISMVHLVQEKVRTNKKKDRSPIDVLPALQYLMSKEEVITIPSFEDAENFETTLQNQKQDFLTITKLSLDQYDYVIKVLAYVGDFCAKRQEPTPLVIAWRKLMETGVHPRENTVSTYMYALSLDESTTLLSGKVADFHDLLFEPNEKTIALRVKRLIASQDPVEAESLLQKLPDKDWTRLRTYIPILFHYCQEGDLTSLLRVYRRMQQSSGVHFDIDTYANIIVSIAKYGGFREGSDPIPGIKDLGFFHSHGPRLFDEIVREMAEDILEINDLAARDISKAFLSSFNNLSDLKIPFETDLPMLCNDPASNSEVIINRVLINATTGCCPRSGSKLQLFQLDFPSRQRMEQTLLTMAKDQFIDFQQKAFIKPGKVGSQMKKKQVDNLDSSYPIEELQKFIDWLKEREGKFTAIVDGANVAYYGHGTVKYSQIQHIVTKLEEMNEKPLVIMPHKYLQNKFQASIGKMQSLSDKDIAFIKWLDDSDMLYRVPPRCLDDYYWMMASIVGEKHPVVDVDNGKGRFPGIRPILISNDQMRDHKLELLEPRLFRRWYSCHIVKYAFPNPYDDEWEDRPVLFSPADSFSREIQGNLPCNNNDGDYEGSLVWHFPVSEWDQNERLCVRLL